MHSDTIYNWILANEAGLRMGVFLGLLLLFLSLELLFARRDLQQFRRQRWVTNLGLVFIDSLVLRVLFPIMAVGVAVMAHEKDWGVFNFIALPHLLEVIFAVILLDGFIYVQHVASHYFKPLWAFHKIHHADRDFDTTTALRFHPVEICLSMLYKMGVVILLGPAALAVIIFEILLNGAAMFNHMNVTLPQWLDRVLRPIIVTPDMHRVHHSIRSDEMHRNFGFCLSVWDRLFGTYTPQPREGHTAMTIGLPDCQGDDSRPQHLVWGLLTPFKNLR